MTAINIVVNHDITEDKAKVVGPLSFEQLLGVGAAAAIFWVVHKLIEMLIPGSVISYIIAFIPAAIPFAIAFLPELVGMPLQDYIQLQLYYYSAPKIRSFTTHNVLIQDMDKFYKDEAAELAKEAQQSPKSKKNKKSKQKKQNIQVPPELKAYS